MFTVAIFIVGLILVGVLIGLLIGYVIGIVKGRSEAYGEFFENGVLCGDPRGHAKD